jgi:outer membrane biosynthesis protein TonB
MKAWLFLTLLCLPIGEAWAQVILYTDIDTTGLTRSRPPEQFTAPAANQCFPRTTTLPEFPGGPQALTRFVLQQIRYPRILLRSHVEGWTGVNFLITAGGHISQATVYHSLHPAWDEEVLRVVGLLDGRFKPATYNGTPREASYSLRVLLSIK